MTHRPHAGVIFPPPLLYVAALAIALLLEWLWPLPIASSTLLWWAGAGVLLLGVGLNLWGARTMIRSQTPINPYRPVAGVVTRGPFRITRNPLYVGLYLVYLGIVLMLNTAWGLVLFGMLVLVMHYGVIRREERYLTEKFGDAYRDYCTRVRRYL